MADDVQVVETLLAEGERKQEAMFGETEVPSVSLAGNLEKRFVVPPFSVLDTRQGYWQERRRAWLSLGIKSEVGRGASLLQLSPAMEAFGYNTKTYRDSGLYEGGGKELAARMDEPAIQRTDNVGKGSRRMFGDENRPDLMKTYGKASGINTGASREGGFTQTMAKGLLSKATERKGMGADYDTSNGENAWGGSGTSIFDPVLCELMYRWFAPPDGVILDPFAGGSVRGIVAAHLGHQYVGVDLSPVQVEANRQQAEAIVPHLPPEWIVGDSGRVLHEMDREVDMVFSCPPYFDLEIYSDDPDDLSNAGDYGSFLVKYQAIIGLACARLRPDRFAVFVVSEIRGPDGTYRGFVNDTIDAFRAAGMRYYNEAILINSAGSLPLRVTKYMEASRKLGRSHQNILVFLKGREPKGWSYDREAPPKPQLELGW